MGVTFLYSSGDVGVEGNGGTCLNPNGESPTYLMLDGYLNDPPGTQTVGGQFFNPTFPGTCPYVTSVGATMVKPNATVFDPEMACMEKIYSGGGFSNHFSIPDYQKDAVESYLAHYPPNYRPTIWNSTGKVRYLHVLELIALNA